MTFQKQIIVSQLGFNALQTTLLSCADGVITGRATPIPPMMHGTESGIAVIGISIGIYLSCIPAIGRGYATIITSIPPLVGSILINLLPSENKVALLFMYWLSCELFVAILVPCSLWSGRMLTARDISRPFSLGQYPVHNLPGMGYIAHSGPHQTYGSDSIILRDASQLTGAWIHKVLQQTRSF